MDDEAMTDKKKTEVNLEMCSGFFRIPTDDIIYNITVLASNEPSTTKVVEKIIEVEKIVEVEKPSPPTPPPVVPPPARDDFFEHCAQKFQHEISLIAQEASSGANSASTPMSAISDLADMATELTNVLQLLKRNASQQGGTGGHSGANITPALERLSEKISQAAGLCPASSAAPVTQAAAPSATKTIIRYLFNLDAVFQTIYELCTNETVKSHIQNARAKAEDIFDINVFYDAISPKVSGYPEDDGFLTVPMTDIYTALSSACSDKATCNLLAKMDQQQASIFLDQFLPLETPPKKEISSVDENSPSNPDSEGDRATTPASDGLTSLLSECQTDLDKLIYQSADLASPGPDCTDELINQIDDAMVIAASIHHDASQLTENNASASSGQCDALGRKIKGLQSLAETMLSMKAQRPDLTYEESLTAGQTAAQHVLDELTARIKSQPPPATASKKAPAKAPKPAEPAPGGEASQDDIDRLLAELG